MNGNSLIHSVWTTSPLRNNDTRMGPFYRRLRAAIAVFVSIALFAGGAFAEEEESARTFFRDFPFELVLGKDRFEGAPISLKKAVDIAIGSSRTLKSVQVDLETSALKLSEAKSSFGTNVKVDANYQRVHDSTAFVMPYTYYDVDYYYIPGVSDPADAPAHLQTTPFYVITDPMPKFGFESIAFNKNWQHGAELKVTKPLFTFGKKKNAVNAANQNVEMKRIEVRIQKQKLILKVKEDYYNMLLSGGTILVQDEALDRVKAHLEAANARFESGVVPKLEVIRARSDFEQAKENLIRGNKNFELARMVLNNTLGLPVSNKTLISPQGAYKHIKLKPLEYYLDLAFSRRPELERIEKAKEAARLAGKLEARTPVIALAGIWTFHNRGSTFGSQDSWRAVVSGSIPIFDEGLASAKKAQYHKAYEKIELGEIDLQEGIRLQVRKARLEMEEASQRVNSSAAILRIAKEAYRMADVGFKEGVIAQINLIDAEQTLNQARLNRVWADFDYEVAKARLAYACGVTTLEKD